LSFAVLEEGQAVLNAIIHFNHGLWTEAKFGNRQLKSYDVFNMAEISEDLNGFNLIEIN